MDDEQLARIAGGRAYATTGVMRSVTIAALVLSTALVMAGMAGLTIS